MTPRERLAARLTALGWRSVYGSDACPVLAAVAVKDIRLPLRKKERDCYRWEADLAREEHPRLTTWLTCFDTVRECATNGVKIEEHAQRAYERTLEVHAIKKEKTKR